MTHSTPGLVCVECDYEMDMSDPVDGGGAPQPGDVALCIRCASLNIFDSDLRFRKPTLEEYLATAADKSVQRTRRAILSIPREERYA